MATTNKMNYNPGGNSSLNLSSLGQLPTSHTVPVPNNQQAIPTLDPWWQRAMESVKTVQPNTLNVNAPSLQLPSFDNLPEIKSFSSDIEKAGALKLQSSLSALREQYPEQKEELDTQLTAAGTYDAGDRNKLYSRMFEKRGTQETQLIQQIQADTLMQQVSEMQRIGQITEDRAKMMIDMEFQAAVKSGDWQYAASIHNSEMNMNIATYNQNALKLTADLKAKGQEEVLAWVDVDLKQKTLDLQRRELDTKESMVAIAKYEQDVTACSLYDEGKEDCIRDAQLEYEAAIGDVMPTAAPTASNKPASVNQYTIAQGQIPIGTEVDSSQLKVPPTISGKSRLSYEPFPDVNGFLWLRQPNGKYRRVG